MVVAVVAANCGEVAQIFGFADKVPGGDKTGHFLLMGGLTFFAVLGIAPRLKLPAARATLVVAGTLAVLITLEEGSQYFLPTRSFSIPDLLCSLAGVLVFGLLACAIVRRQRFD